MAEKRKLLLIGCGDLPSRLVRLLDLDHWQISGLRKSAMPLADLQMTYGDAADPRVISELLNDQPDQLIITLTPVERSLQAYQRTYLEPARCIAKSARELAPNCHLLFVSSTSVYSQNSGELVDESSLTEPGQATAQVLLEAEQQISSSGNPWSIVRFSGIYGPGRERLLSKVKSRQFSDLNEAAWTNRIHSVDCARILAFLLNKPDFSKAGAGILMGTDSQPSLNIEVENWLALKLGVDRESGGSQNIESAKGKRCSNRKLLGSGFAFRYPSFKEGYASLIGT